VKTSVAEAHHFYAAPGKNFDAAPAPTLVYSKPIFLKQTKVNERVEATLSLELCMIEMAINVNGESKKLLQFVTFLIISLCSTLSLEPEPLVSETKPYRVTAPAPAPPK
jgi:hypothetical protein